MARGMDLAVRRVLLTSVCLLIVNSGHNVYLREPLSEEARSTMCDSGEQQQQVCFCAVSERIHLVLRLPAV